MSARFLGSAPSFGVYVYEPTAGTVGPLTTLLPFEALGRQYYRLMFWAENPGTADVTLILSTSERGVLPDAANYQTVIQSGQQGHIDMLNTLYQYWELEAHTDPGSGYPVQSLTWGVVGVPRQWGNTQ